MKFLSIELTDLVVLSILGYTTVKKWKEKHNEFSINNKMVIRITHRFVYIKNDKMVNVALLIYGDAYFVLERRNIN